LRISGGSLRGRITEAPKSSRTHPMGERVRSGLFNTLGDIKDLTILDSFAGSGILSFEAISRGAAHATAIDEDRQAQAAIKASIIALDLSEQVSLVKTSAASWMSRSTDSFDVVLLDPPYDRLQQEVLIKLANRAKPGGVIVLSAPPTAKLNLPDSCQLLTIKNYGDAELAFYRMSTTVA
jgi:16S rRNA (guanine966-N2)-methyltransferase